MFRRRWTACYSPHRNSAHRPTQAGADISAPGTHLCEPLEVGSKHNASWRSTCLGGLGGAGHSFVKVCPQESLCILLIGLHMLVSVDIHPHSGSWRWWRLARDLCMRRIPVGEEWLHVLGEDLRRLHALPSVHMHVHVGTPCQPRPLNDVNEFSDKAEDCAQQGAAQRLLWRTAGGAVAMGSHQSRDVREVRARVHPQTITGTIWSCVWHILHRCSPLSWIPGPVPKPAPYMCACGSVCSVLYRACTLCSVAHTAHYSIYSNCWWHEGGCAPLA